mgnify:CR=1 FL=1
MPPLVWDMVKELYYIRSRPIPMKTTTVHERYGAGILIPHTKGVAAEVDLMMKNNELCIY